MKTRLSHFMMFKVDGNQAGFTLLRGGCIRLVQGPYLVVAVAVAAAAGVRGEALQGVGG